ncbi:MerR family transcriptional regulator [Kitasatospora sp. DSM 101779]|uniref:MerR family transcriptional regulator n=1 Tax=Kitasatospora sp. DSM 101779 TaxID=2853165 RepID=UPI0021DAF170|nr:helix-turn-helix domain-containing protein [Kitasatospora sp. DSM 101779]MCU7820481.1 helix-turn-helix domain-containing protein [Kitasatospora sp. DSM 101779]
MVDGPELLTVGQLARRAGLTAKALRHYDRVGLLVPAVVDPGTGYRYYGVGQVAHARLVRLLRSVDVPLEQVRLCLADPDDEAVAARVLADHRRRLQARLDRVRGDLHRIDHLLQDGVARAMTDTAAQPAATTPDDGERRLAVDLFNGVWRLLEKEDRTVEEDDRMLHMAHASRHHWGQVGQPVNLSRGEWQCSRVYSVLGRSEPAIHHATRSLQICREHGIGDWDLAFAYEALARAHAVAGDLAGARTWTEQALAAAEDIAEDDDRELVLTDLESVPHQPRFW